MPQCPECKVSMFTDTAGEWTCIECGRVEQQVDLVEPELPPPTFQPAVNNRYSRVPVKNYSLIHSLRDTLQLNAEDTKKAKSYFKALNESDESWPTGTYGKLRAMACIYFAVKQKRPLSLSKMAHDCQVTLSQLGKAVKWYEQVLKDYDLAVESPPTQPNSASLYLERCCSALTPTLSPNDRLKVVERCKFLIRLANSNYIVEGRSPLGIAAAVIFFGLESYKLKKYVTAAGKKKICKELEISLSTANERYKEIQALLIKKASVYFPWDTTEKNLMQSYEDLEKLLLCEERDETNLEEESNTQLQRTGEQNIEDVKPGDVLPPSFVAAKKARDIRYEKLQRAKERIQSTVKENKVKGLLCSKFEIDDKDSIESNESGVDTETETDKSKNTPDTWDNEDLLIESLLLKGVPEDVILEGYYNCGLEITRPIQYDIDSEQLNDNDLTEEELASYLTGYKRPVPEDLPSLPTKKFCL